MVKFLVDWRSFFPSRLSYWKTTKFNGLHFSTDFLKLDFWKTYFLLFFYRFFSSRKQSNKFVLSKKCLNMSCHMLFPISVFWIAEHFEDLTKELTLYALKKAILKTHTERGCGNVPLTTKCWWHETIGHSEAALFSKVVRALFRHTWQNVFL